MNLKVMTRKGIIINDEKYATKCKAEDHPIFNYELKIVFGKKVQLDEDGFIFDHNLINQEIKENVEVRSCELLADDILDVVRRYMKRNKIKIKGLRVTILPVLPIPNDGAYFQQIWWKGTDDIKGMLLSNFMASL